MIRILTILLICISCKPDLDMRIKDINANKIDAYIFDIVEEKTDNPLDWKIESRFDKLIPDTEAHCIVRAKMIDSNKTVSDCFVNISLPERIVDFVIYENENGLVFKQTYELENTDVIPAIASEAYGVYELYYSKNNPDIGIEILKNGLNLADDPSVIAEDLGYILRDENRHEEALEAFLVSEKHGVSNDYIYKEIHDLYVTLGKLDSAKEYVSKIQDL
jgi:tetratricopeptide (TPR) repeat protein